MLSAIADEVTVRFTVQVLILLVVLANLLSVRAVLRAASRLEEEQKYLLDYKKELAEIRHRIHVLHPDE